MSRAKPDMGLQAPDLMDRIGTLPINAAAFAIDGWPV
jgi:hypothetical protein